MSEYTETSKRIKMSESTKTSKRTQISKFYKNF